MINDTFGSNSHILVSRRHEMITGEHVWQDRNKRVWNYVQIFLVEKWSEVKHVCPQAAREGHRWKKTKLHFVHCNALQVVFFMSGIVRVQKVTKCGMRFDHRFASRATSNQLPNCWYLQNFWIIVSQVLRGRPVLWCPLQVQVRMRADQRFR